MDVTSKFLFILAAFLFSTYSMATEVDQCLVEAKKRPHVIDQQQSIEACFQSHRKSLSQKKCYALATQIKASTKHFDMSETLNSFCFYQTTDFTDLKSCLNQAQLFKLADNHDEAIFECYRQFQNQLSQKQCVEVSRRLIYPAKKNYLFQHCQSNR